MVEYSTEEVESYMANAREKLTASELLFKNRLYSDSISRSYYAMYSAARAALLLEGITPKTHRGTLSEFGLHYVKEGLVDELHARTFSVALEDRGEADYGIIEDFTEEEAKQVLEDAKAFSETIEMVIRKVGKRK